MANIKMITWVSVIIVIAGAIDLGLIGLAKIDIISSILGQGLGRLVFIIVGAAAGYLIYLKVNKKIALQVL